MKCDCVLVRTGVAAHDDKRLWKAVDGRQGTMIPGGSESKKCSLTKNDIHARIALREEARWQGKGDRLREKLRVEDRELIGTVSFLMPSKVPGRVQGVQMQQTRRWSVLLRTQRR